MKRVGITGVMGAGKSTVCRVFEMLGIPHYDCDQRAKILMNNSLKTKIIDIFGSSAYLECGELNRAYLASKIFNDSELKEQLEAVVHPAVHKDLQDWCFEHRRKPFVLVESAILLNGELSNDMDYIVVVHTNHNEIIGRVKLRDGWSEEQIIKRLEVQVSQKEMLESADFTVFTSDDELLTPKVVELHKKMLTLSQN